MQHCTGPCNIGFFMLIHQVGYFIMLLRDCSAIRGMRYFDSFVTANEKENMLEVINSNPWCTRLLRKQQYYGIKYFQTNIQDPVLQPALSIGHLSLKPWQFLIDRLTEQYPVFNQTNPPNQVLVNQYLKNHRLGLHVEDKQAFGDVIVGLSLGSTEYLRLVNANNPNLEYGLELKDRSCYVLSGQARQDWKHGIGRIFQGRPYKHQDFKRISLTVRHVIESRRKIDS